MYEIWDVQVGRLLAEGLRTFTEARERAEGLLADVRDQVEATGDSVEAIVLEWEIGDAGSSEVVADRWGAPLPLWCEEEGAFLQVLALAWFESRHGTRPLPHGLGDLLEPRGAHLLRVVSAGGPWRCRARTGLLRQRPLAPGHSLRWGQSWVPNGLPCDDRGGHSRPFDHVGLDTPTVERPMPAHPRKNALRYGSAEPAGSTPEIRKSRPCRLLT